MDLTGSTVWVVDDDPDYTLLMQRILSKSGAMVRTFSGGPEVLARVNTHLALARAKRELAAANAGLAEEIRQRKVVEKEREALIQELESALQKIRTMAPLIPVCSNCRKIRDDKGYWTRLERYLTEYTGSMVTHGICPDCVKELYPELDEPEES